MEEFVCQRCGRCCGLVPFERKEYKAVWRLAKKFHVTFVKEIVKNHVVYFVKSIVNKARIKGVENLNPDEIACPFLGRNPDQTTFCQIYEYRPMMCRKFGKDWKQGELMRCPKDTRIEVLEYMAGIKNNA